MAKKRATLEGVAKSVDDLAGITAKGFESVHKEVAEVRAELKGDTHGIKGEIQGLKGEVEEINIRLEKYYHPILESHGRRIKTLEKHAN